MKWINCRSAALAVAACTLACVPEVRAQERPLAVSLNYGVTWDDNVFRVPESAPDPQASGGIAGKSDRSSTASVGLHVNLPFSMQRILLDATRAAVRYEKFSSLDQDPFSYRGAWQWHVTPRVSGIFSANRGETRVDVEDVEGRRRVDQSTTTLAATAAARLWSGWHVLGGVSESETKYSPPSFERPNTRQTTADAGLRYVAQSGSLVSLTRRTTHGTETITDPAILGGSDFTQDDTELSATWIATGHSTFTVRVTHVDRRNELLPQRDFSGNTGELRHAWRATGKLNFDWWLSRAVTPYNLNLQSTSRVDDTIGAALLWRATERISVRSSASRQINRFGQISTSFEARRDVSDTVEVGAAWAPHRSISFDARLRHEERDSSDALQIFDANSASLSFSLRF